MYVCYTSFKSSGGTSSRTYYFFQMIDIGVPCITFVLPSTQTNLRKFKLDTVIQKKEVQFSTKLKLQPILVLFGPYLVSQTKLFNATHNVSQSRGMVHTCEVSARNLFSVSSFVLHVKEYSTTRVLKARANILCFVQSPRILF